MEIKTFGQMFDGKEKSMASKVCSGCTHFSACASWNVGSIVDMKACVNFDDQYKRDQFLADTQAHIAKMQLTIDFLEAKVKHLQGG